MSDLPEDANPGDEELDLGEVDEEAEGDAGQEDEEHADDGGSDEGQEEGEEAGDVEPPAREGRQAGRRETQSQRLRRQNEELKQELAEARGFRQATEQFRPQQPQVDQAALQRAQQERADRLSMMSPVEAAEYIANEKMQLVAQALQNQQVTIQDRIDKQAYDQQARNSRVHEQYRQQVESLFASERARGNIGADRQSILEYLVGKDAVARASRAAPAQRRAANARVRGQQTRPTGARGDGASGSRRPVPGSAEHDEQLISEFFQSGGRL